MLNRLAAWMGKMETTCVWMVHYFFDNGGGNEPGYIYYNDICRTLSLHDVNIYIDNVNVASDFSVNSLKYLDSLPSMAIVLDFQITPVFFTIV